MKKLPLNRQEFQVLIEDNCIYVDKTQQIYNLMNFAQQYFFSRPRRFGKSLLITTLREIYSGNKELFKGLWIYDKIDWKPHPVIHIDFSGLDYREQSLKKALSVKLDEIAEEQSIILTKDTLKDKFTELVRNLSQSEKVVILIDEYDKPIIDYFDDLDQADTNREVLKYFYSAIKPCNKYIKFLFITGVSKFSKVSIFSDLNHLIDITMHKKFNSLVGINQEELEYYFSDYIAMLADEYKEVHTDIVQAIRDEYLGYSWDGSNFVYNPFTLVHLFGNVEFSAHWFKTGTPTFLIKMIKDIKLTRYDFDDITVTSELLDKYQIHNMTLIPLLFQTGYLTVKKRDLFTNQYLLDFPNREVERLFSLNLIAEFNGGRTDKTDTTLNQMTARLRNGEIDRFMELLKILFKGIVYSHIDDEERYYHSIFYLIVKMIGFYVDSEVMDATGRIDVVIKTKTQIIVVEFKTTTAEKAMQQIKAKQYHLKYMDDKRQIVLLGIGFDVQARNVSGYLKEEVKPGV